MSNYTVTWTVDVEAASPSNAVLEVAKEYFQDRIAQGQPGTACVFRVIQSNVIGSATVHDVADIFKSMDQHQLRQYFGTQHPQHDRYMWIEEVTREDTLLGYWEWVKHQMESGQ